MEPPLAPPLEEFFTPASGGWAADEKLLVHAYRMPFPGLGRVERHGDVFSRVPWPSRHPCHNSTTGRAAEPRQCDIGVSGPEPYCMAAAAMSLELHGRGSHAVCTSGTGATGGGFRGGGGAWCGEAVNWGGCGAVVRGGSVGRGRAWSHDWRS